jgi:hypothetical protein
MLQADSVKVEWNSSKKRWEVRILVGEEVIKRPIDQHLTDTSEAALKELAVATARDEGYEVSPEHVEAVGSHGPA